MYNQLHRSTHFFDGSGNSACCLRIVKLHILTMTFLWWHFNHQMVNIIMMIWERVCTTLLYRTHKKPPNLLSRTRGDICNPQIASVCVCSLLHQTHTKTMRQVLFLCPADHPVNSKACMHAYTRDCRFDIYVRVHGNGKRYRLNKNWRMQDVGCRMFVGPVFELL